MTATGTSWNTGCGGGMYTGCNCGSVMYTCDWAWAFSSNLRWARASSSSLLLSCLTLWILRQRMQQNMMIKNAVIICSHEVLRKVWVGQHARAKRLESYVCTVANQIRLHQYRMATLIYRIRYCNHHNIPRYFTNNNNALKPSLELFGKTHAKEEGKDNCTKCSKNKTSKCSKNKISPSHTSGRLSKRE